MSKLLRKEQKEVISEGVTLLQMITAKNSELEYIETKVIDMETNSIYEESLLDFECCIVVLTGKADITAGKHSFTNLGTRTSVFEKKPTDSVYVPRQNSFKVTSNAQTRLVLCYSPTKTDKSISLIKAEDNTAEARGKYNNQRLVHNILPDSSPISDLLLVVEVYTEGGNFSSYPPHKHDQNNLPHESFLEETYYHEINPPQGFVFQRVYTDDRSLDETMAVENGNIVVVPKGYHPVGVPDGYTSYYLNIMAGPIKKWQFHNDPDHEWILDRK